MATRIPAWKAKFCDAFLRCHDPRRAAEEAGMDGDCAMLLGDRTVAAELERRRALLAGQLTREDLLLRLAELAFGRANDCVRLALEEEPPVAKLDLSLLSEVKRGANGVVEVKLTDRLKVLEAMSAMLAGGGGCDELFGALERMGGQCQ